MTTPDFFSAIENGEHPTPRQAAELLAQIIDCAPPKPTKQEPPPLCGPVQIPKPCPFCGGTPEVRYEIGDERNGYSHEVTYRCRGCGCSTVTKGIQGRRSNYADNSTVEARALAAWNRRAKGATNDRR